jgi:hypothetical protein
MKERELLIRSVVSLILAACGRVDYVCGIEDWNSGWEFRALICTGRRKLVVETELQLKFIHRALGATPTSAALASRSHL